MGQGKKGKRRKYRNSTRRRVADSTNDDKQLPAAAGCSSKQPTSREQETGGRGASFRMCNKTAKKYAYTAAATMQSIVMLGTGGSTAGPRKDNS